MSTIAFSGKLGPWPHVPPPDRVHPVHVVHPVHTPPRVESSALADEITIQNYLDTAQVPVNVFAAIVRTMNTAVGLRGLLHGRLEG